VYPGEVTRFAFLFAVLAACGGDGVGIGGECSQQAACEDGATCDLTDPDGAVCIDAAGDLDGDGLQNGADFCNHAPGGEFDEDADGIGDDCDRCPIAPPPEQADRDTDEVDSPCDPDPDVDGDEIVAFNGFNDPDLPTGWMATSGWQIIDGEAVATSADLANNEILVAPLPLVSLHMAVLSQYRIDGVDAQATAIRVGVIAVDARPAGGTDVTCVSVRTGAADNLVLDTTLNASNDPFLSNLFDTSASYRVTLALANANAGCALVSAAETGATTAGTQGEAMNQGGLIARGVTARYPFLLAIQRGTVANN